MKLLSMQKSNVSNIVLSMEHWEQGVQEDQKNKQTNKPTKQTNKKPPKNQNQNKT